MKKYSLVKYYILCVYIFENDCEKNKILKKDKILA